MKLVAGGTFLMGDTLQARPVHSVTVSSFYMDSTEVTQADYQTLLGVNPSRISGPGALPVESETWFDAALYCNARSRRDGLDTVYRYEALAGTPGLRCSDLGNLVIDYAKNGYRLPTEAEWEYACRAGTSTAFYWGNDTSAATVGRHAWYYPNSADSTRAVASLTPNSLGLYDMNGNVWEWCNDKYGAYSGEAQTDPRGPESGESRISRGGCWSSYDTGDLVSAKRFSYYQSYAIEGSNMGFRCVRPR